MKQLTGNIKSFFCLCLVATLHAGNAQNKIFYSSAGLTNPASNDSTIDKIRLPWGRLGRNILVKYANGSQLYYTKKKIWGFEKDGRKLRLYDREIFEIVDSNVIVLYKTYSPHPVYYFSEHLDSSVNLLERAKLIKILNAETLLALWKENGIVRQMFR